jgi:hypothetical protein
MNNLELAIWLLCILDWQNDACWMAGGGWRRAGTVVPICAPIVDIPSPRRATLRFMQR